ncbi:MAG TPA: sensor histidine kinase KdpD [Rhodoblastus sp.]|nr:sensor histidine kinase KdpD [Rhodoblastus sp.]
MATEHEIDRHGDSEALSSGSQARGKLKIFLGAAPGAATTCAMLAAARRLRAEQVDVMIGIVDAPTRPGVAALLAGQDILPRRRVRRRGHENEEFDLDAALERRPALIVIDELAHDNAPGSRNARRWQDVEALLDAGLDVWTTLNIENLESLAEATSRITGVAIRETVPDRIVQRADEVALLDIAPDELLRRLRQSNAPSTGEADAGLADRLRPCDGEAPEHLLVCIGADAQADMVARAGARLAAQLRASWVVVHVALEGHEETDPAKLWRVDQAFRLAERLGAETARLTATDAVGEILRYARREKATQVVASRPRRGEWRRWLRRDFTSELVRRGADLPVHVILAPDAPSPVRTSRRFWRNALRARLWRGALAAIVAVGITVPVAFGLKRGMGAHNVAMVFLLAVLICAERFGLWSAIAASVLSYLAYSFFISEPIFSFRVSAPEDFLALLVFLVVAILTGTLAGRVHDKSEEVRARARYTELLYDFSRKLSAAARLDDALSAAATHLQRALGGSVVFLLPRGDELRLAAACPPLDHLAAEEKSAARLAFANREATGWGAADRPEIAFQFRPLVTPRDVVGICGFRPADAQEALSPEDERALTAMLEQTAIAIDRSLLVGEAVRSAALEENEKLRTTLLSSLSHDLKTPLSAITGAVTSLQQLGDRMSADDRRDLLASIEEEAARLSRFVANLLDMSRLESGAVKVRREFLDPAEIVRSAVERARKVFPRMRIETSLERDLPFIRGDAGLLEQVLFNLLDNAHKYGGKAGANVAARLDGAQIVIAVADEGPGIKTEDLDRIFEKFYRGGRSDGRKAGTGLGLSICKGLVEAMGGGIEAQSPILRRRGARLVVRMPVAVLGGEEKT